ncbi:hypothetical protein OF83DRAFT_1116125 [Amylostereum chailletii]|nr:hypothetical protein OF83DRAFT_1116125 [Amylostereum chailletii]
MSILLSPILSLYDKALMPLPALAWTGASISPLDVAGALRLAIALRQIREMLYKEHIKTMGVSKNARSNVSSPEPRGRARDVAATLVMVYGGEAIVSSWLGFPPSFMLDGVMPGLFVAAHFAVEAVPSVPSLGLTTELPASILDAFTRALLVCDIATAAVTTHASRLVVASPWTLLLTSFIFANAGPFLTSLFSLLPPTPISLTTPPELLPYGWTSTDLWIAPLSTALYATLTHAQPFFTTLHALLFSFFQPIGLASITGEGALEAVDPQTARAACVALLSACFVTRTVKKFGVAPIPAAHTTIGFEKRDMDGPQRQIMARVSSGNNTGPVSVSGKKAKIQ